MRQTVRMMRTLAVLFAVLLLPGASTARQPSQGPPGGTESLPVTNLNDVMVWTFNEGIYTPAEVDKASYVAPQYCMRSWFKYSGIRWDYFTDPALGFDSLPPLLNDRGAVLEGGVQVSDLHQSAGWPADSTFDDDHKPPYEIPDGVFDDFRTRDADGNFHAIETIYGFDEFHTSITNENYRDFVLFWAEEQMDSKVNALEFDVISGGYRFTPDGTLGDNPNEGYEDYAIGTANFPSSLSVVYARGTSEPVRWFTPLASASSALQPASAAFDDNEMTYWLSSIREPVHTLEIDFGRPRTVQQLVVEVPLGRSLASFRLERWSESAGWTDFVPAIAVSGNAQLARSFLVDPVATSKVRLVSSEMQAAVAELHIFGAGFRQYLLAKYCRDQGWAADDPRWTTQKLVNLHDPLQCPDGTMNSFDYRGYLAAKNWTGNPFGRAITEGDFLDPANPLFLDWFPDHYFRSLDALLRTDPDLRQEVRDIYLASFCAQRLLTFWKTVVDTVRGYAAAKGQPLFVTSNGVAPYVDYILGGWATSLLFPSYPAPSAGDPEGTGLDGSQAQITMWRDLREDALSTRRWLASGTTQSESSRDTEDVPVVTFLDFGYNGMPFHHLGGADMPADLRIEYLRIYAMEAYAAGVAFCFPVRANQENAWTDIASDETRVIDAIKQQTDFLNARREIYQNVAPDPREALVTVNGIVPFNGGWNLVGGQNDSPVNASKVTIAYTAASDGSKYYLHVINHLWDTQGGRIIPQENVPVAVPMAGCRRVTAVSPDSPGEVEIPFTENEGVVSLTLPSLAHYNVVILDKAPPFRLVKDPASPTGYYFYFAKVAGATGYNLYEGTLGVWYDHGTGAHCDVAFTDLGTGELRTAIVPTGKDAYFVVTAHDETVETPSGYASSGTERDPAQNTCQP